MHILKQTVFIRLNVCKTTYKCNDGDNDAERDEHHRKEQILADERDDKTRRRNDFDEKKKEHRQRNQNRYAK